ncbi:MAG: hypothetical protein E8D46_17535 [Nitrospira sp.]|nr:MAG: hypothetical protein E8D46_17535 [Nitrospira sp.]
MIFPLAIPHNSGTKLKLDDTLLLLGFRKPIASAKVQHLLDQTSVRLEEPVHTQEQNGHQFKRKVNHTNRLYWVHSKDGKSILDKHLASLRLKLANELEWVGPVLRFPATKAIPNGHPVCALPSVLIVKPKTEAITGDLDHALITLGLRYQADISQYLNGLRLYYLVPSSNHQVLPPTAAHDLQINLRDKRYKYLVAATYLNFMPMFVPTASPTSDPQFGQQWNLLKIQAEAGWAKAGWVQEGTTSTAPFPAGAMVRVAIIDDGCDLDHEDLSSAFDKTNAATFYPSNPHRTPNPQIGPIGTGTNPLDGGRAQGADHGTRCAGVLGARCNNKNINNNYIGITGLAGACEILPLRLDGNSTFELQAAITYAVSKGCNVISYSNVDPLYYDPSVLIALQGASSAKTVICAAAGNGNSDHVGYPAAYKDYVIACGATDDSYHENRCTGGVWSSNTGNGSNYGDALSVAAPGINIPTCDIGSGYISAFEGTSAATPQVAALAALIMSRHPILKGQPVLVREIIEGSADKVGTLTVNDPNYPLQQMGTPLTYTTTAAHPNGSWSREIGYGRINVFKAMKRACQVVKAILLPIYPSISDLKLLERSPRPPKIPPGPRRGTKKGTVRG